jgi:opacity protein-like surface antigen
MRPKLETLAALAVLLLIPVLAHAQAAPPPPPAGPTGVKEGDNETGWTAKAGLSYVGSGGNSEATSLGFKWNASYNWTKTYFSLIGSGVRADSTKFGSFAVGPTDDDFVVTDVEVKEKTAENYLLEAGLDHNMTSRFFWQTGAGFKRDTFAGIDSRLAARAGVGYYFTDPASKGVQFKSAVLATLTHETETVENPATDDTFVGLRALLDFQAPFGPEGKNSFASRLAADENLQTTDDFRTTWWNNLSVSMTDRLALQVSLLLNYDNLPALAAVNRYGNVLSGVPVPPVLGTVFVPLKKWDREFSVSFVLNLVPKKAKAAPPAGS